MAFRPSTHGWPFASVQGVEAHVLGLGALPTAASALGGGLCWAALDRYLRGTRIPEGIEAPEPGEALHSELVRRQVASLTGVWSRVREWHGRPDGSWRDRLPVRMGGGRDLASLTTGEWPSIRSRLKAGEPVLLSLLLPVDPYRGHRGVRQVLATDWKVEDGRVVLSIYDPERPGDDRVALSFAKTGPLGALLSDGSEVRGFMATPYDRVAPSPLRAESFGDRAVLGLNRKVRGRLAAVTSRRRIDLLARSPEGSLLHFHRTGQESWEGANITEREELGSYELYGDPVAVRSAGLHVFARNYVGDLLHFRLGRKWSVSNRTEHKRAGARFRLTGDPLPVAGPRGRINVLGLDKDGGLVHYSGRPILGWSVEQVAGDPLATEPVALWAGSTLHVAGRARDGRILHWEWDGESWTATDLSALEGLKGSRVVGRISLHMDDEAVYLAGRSADDRPMVLRKTADEAWSATQLAATVAGDPILGSGPAGIHLFAPADGGGLLHAWQDGEWLHEEVLESRSSLPTVPRPAALACWGSGEELRVWGRVESDLWMLVWRPDSDWVLERLSERSGVARRHRPGDDPVLVEDAGGQPHLFFTDGEGTVLHVEPSEWQEPGPESGPAPAAEIATEVPREARIAPTPSAAPTEGDVEPPAAAEAKSDSSAEADSDMLEPEWTVYSEADLEEIAGAEPVEPAGAEPVEPAEAEPNEPAEAEPNEPVEIRPVMAEAATEAATEEAEATPAADGASGADPAPDLPYLDFEADPPPPPTVAAVPESERAAGTRGEAEAGEAADEEAAEEAVGDVADEAAGDAADSGSSPAATTEEEDAPGVTKQPAGPKKVRIPRKQPWQEGPVVDPSAAELEPMDLSLLDSWPEGPRSLRKERKQKGDRKRKTS